MADASEPHTFTILHTNDLHGHLLPWRGWEGDLAGKMVGGFDRLAGRVQRIRAEVGPERVLLLDAGDAIGDTLLAEKTQGRAIIDVMNALGYDAMAVGNHEPDFGAAGLRARMADAHFPILAANLLTNDGDLFTKPYLIREVGGVRVGILGLAYPNTPLTSAAHNMEGMRFRPAIETARAYIPRVRADGAEVIIALTHLGLTADVELARVVEGIDVIISGHSHNRMNAATRVGNTLIVQAGAHGSDLGRLDLTIKNGRVTAHRRSLLPIIGGAPDPRVAAVIERDTAPYAASMQESAGRIEAPLVRAQTLAGQTPRKRDRESPADDLFADAIREMTGAEIAFLPGVGYGVAAPPGDLSAYELRNYLPHDSAVRVMQLSGAGIRETLEQSIENVMAPDPAQRVGGMIQVSGLQFTYDASRPKGKRVVSVLVGDAALDPNRRYLIAVNGLLAQGGHHYAAFAQGEEVREVGRQYEMVREWLARRPPVPVLTGRITAANQAEKDGAPMSQEETLREHRVVFEVNVTGEETWTGILNNVENLMKAFGAESTHIEVVAHGKGLGLLLATGNTLGERLQRLTDQNVMFLACENTMRRMKTRREDLLPLAGTVDSGVAEVVRRQEAGWAYIKGGS